jgi:hypothetical protein
MFRWYRDAAICYVYLADVSVTETPGNSIEKSPGLPYPWSSVFQGSKWFTRGWTLQELLAPATVEFFDSGGIRLGDKSDLMEDIHAATGIPFKAFQGSASSLSDFSVDQRMSWAVNRETKREEDAAYSLFGLFDLHMPLIYGEGRRYAFIRLHREIRRTLRKELVIPQRQIDADIIDSPTTDTSGSSPRVDVAKQTVVHADIRVMGMPWGGVELGSAPRLDITEDAQRMKMWWDEANSENMNTRGKDFLYQMYVVQILTSYPLTCRWLPPCRCITCEMGG